MHAYLQAPSLQDTFTPSCKEGYSSTGTFEKKSNISVQGTFKYLITLLIKFFKPVVVG